MYVDKEWAEGLSPRTWGNPYGCIIWLLLIGPIPTHVGEPYGCIGTP